MTQCQLKAELTLPLGLHLGDLKSSMEETFACLLFTEILLTIAKRQKQAEGLPMTEGRLSG